jgi:hypothetical protein
MLPLMASYIDTYGHLDSSRRPPLLIRTPLIRTPLIRTQDEAEDHDDDQAGSMYMPSRQKRGRFMDEEGIGTDGRTPSEHDVSLSAGSSGDQEPSLFVAAKRGNPIAMCELGRMFLHGYGPCIQDDRKAFELFNRAAEKNYPEALLELAAMYINDTETIPQDLTSAEKCIGNAIDLGTQVPIALLHSFAAARDDAARLDRRVAASVARGLSRNEGSRSLASTSGHEEDPGVMGAITGEISEIAKSTYRKTKETVGNVFGNTMDLISKVSHLPVEATDEISEKILPAAGDAFASEMPKVADAVTEAGLFRMLGPEAYLRRLAGRKHGR